MLTNEERAALLGNPLTQAIDAYIANPTNETLANFCAELLGRGTSMSAAVLVGLIGRVEDLESLRAGMTAAIAEMIDLHERVEQLEAPRDG